MDMKKMILNSGLSYRELLLMKSYYRTYRKQNHDQDELITDIEDFEGFIFFIAKDSFHTIRILTYITLFMTIGTYFSQYDFSHTFVMFVICLFPYLVAVHLSSKEHRLKITTVIKLIALHIKKITLMLTHCTKKHWGN